MSVRNKFNVRTDAIGKRARTVDDILFASVKEAKHYVTLKQLVRAGQISHLELQPKFALRTCKGGEYFNVCEYWADFSYRSADGSLVVEDVKGMDTELSKLKRKWLKIQNGIDVVII